MLQLPSVETSEREATARRRAAPERASALSPYASRPRPTVSNRLMLQRAASGLRIGRVDDPLEREADRIAEQLMGMAVPVGEVSVAAPGLNRVCVECKEEAAEDGRGMLHRKESGPGLDADVGVPTIVEEVLRTPAEGLDANSRAFFEPRFGRDLSAVRIHRGEAADQSARAVGALAYTVGTDIVFESGRYASSSGDGRRLLAHELAHVVQQAQPQSLSVNGRAEPSATPGPVAVARAPKPGHCGGEWKCAETPCDTPDIAGNGSEATAWELMINIDTDVEAATDITGAEDVGHTYVQFNDSTGARYTYGFYPQPGLSPEPFFKPEVFGCVVHADNNHRSCVDWTERYSVTQQQYNDALRLAQLMCKAPPHYNVLTYNCTTFAVDIAKRAGQSAPSPKGKVGGGVTADNPNTLKDAYRDQHIPTWRLTSDGAIRDWISAHSTKEIADLPTKEKIRLLNRLLDGWISDDDVGAFEKICSTVTDADERAALQTALDPRLPEMHTAAQKQRVNAALHPP